MKTNKDSVIRKFVSDFPWWDNNQITNPDPYWKKKDEIYCNCGSIKNKKCLFSNF
ncbi:MAG: hypothetical protein ABI688_05615 [Bacteroidota bacterium]